MQQCNENERQKTNQSYYKYDVFKETKFCNLGKKLIVFIAFPHISHSSKSGRI